MGEKTAKSIIFKYNINYYMNDYNGKINIQCKSHVEAAAAAPTTVH